MNLPVPVMELPSSSKVNDSRNNMVVRLRFGSRSTLFPVLLEKQRGFIIHDDSESGCERRCEGGGRGSPAPESTGTERQCQ